MIHNLEVTIQLDLMGLSQEKYLEIVAKLSESMLGQEKLTFEELDKLFVIGPRKYISASIDYADMDHDEFIPKTTKIEIRG